MEIILREEKKQQIRRRIMETAEAVIVNDGISELRMEQIARASGMSRRSLYRYYQSKDSLIMEIAIGQFQQWNSVQQAVFNSLSGTPSEKLEDFLKQLAAYGDRNRDLLIFMAEFDHHFRNENGIELLALSTAVPENYFQMLSFTEVKVSALLEEGIACGEFRKTDPGRTALLIDHVLWIMGQNVAKRSEILGREFGFNPTELVYKQIEIYMEWLKNEK